RSQAASSRSWRWTESVWPRCGSIARQRKARCLRDRGIARERTRFDRARSVGDAGNTVERTGGSARQSIGDPGGDPVAAVDLAIVRRGGSGAGRGAARVARRCRGVRARGGARIPQSATEPRRGGAPLGRARAGGARGTQAAGADADAPAGGGASVGGQEAALGTETAAPIVARRVMRPTGPHLSARARFSTCLRSSRTRFSRFPFR